MPTTLRPQPLPSGAAGPLAGERVLFEGLLECLSRSEAAALVRRLGGRVVRTAAARPTVRVLGGGREAEPAAPQPAGGELPGERTLSEPEFCRLAGIRSAEELRSRYHAASEIRARYPQLREDRLRYLERLGLVHPAEVTRAERYYAFDALARLASVHARLEAGASFRAVVRELRVEGSGQLTLDLRPRTRGATVIPFPIPSAEAGAEALFRRGYALEAEPGREAEAEAAYAEALRLDCRLVPALINLANLHYLRDDPTGARALYRRAAELGGGAYFQIPFNLGNIALDQEDFTEARRLYACALELEPEYADTHLYLAVALEKLGRSREARPHWRSYRELAPNGEWVRLAREMERWG
ncbi:MAG: tetratricopeptide repeat protein [Gemmatimonadota bacterium]